MRSACSKFGLVVVVLAIFSAPVATAQEGKESDESLAEIGAKLKQAVADGLMTDGEAMEKYKAAVAASQANERPAPINLDELGEKLKEAVAAGKMTEEEAMAKYKEAVSLAQRGIRVPNEKPTRIPLNERQAAFKAKLGQLVEAGKITTEEAIDLYISAFGND